MASRTRRPDDAQLRSADFQSAVSQACSLRRAAAWARIENFNRPAATKPCRSQTGDTADRRSALSMSHRMNRRHYADMFGPTTGDKVRLGDTSLWLEVER